MVPRKSTANEVPQKTFESTDSKSSDWLQYMSSKLILGVFMIVLHIVDGNIRQQVYCL